MSCERGLGRQLSDSLLDPRACGGVLLHALVKEDVVPEADIDLAVVRKNAYARDPEGHTFHGPMP